MSLALGDRMKEYEKIANYKVIKRLPVIIRLDGKAFHTFTRHMKKPFDEKLMSEMIQSAYHTINQIQGFKLAYIQSDEVNILMTDYDKLETCAWFDNKIQKITSISASYMSVAMSRFYPDNDVIFDSRCFNIPKEEIINYFLWRAKDWQRNSLQMFARSYFSHKQLHKKKHDDIHEMLHDKGVNWATDLTPIEKNGTFIKLNINDGKYIQSSDVLPIYDSINEFIDDLKELIF